VHAFDYDKLAGGEVKNMTIRHARKDEKVTDLTDLEHVLDETMMVVADAEKALDVAGVKGGANSGVDENTTRIILSACNYDPKAIRHTSKIIPEDIIEEIGRMYGLYNIPELPIAEGFEIPSKNTLKQSWYRTGDALVQLGFYEVYNRSLVHGGVVPLANSLNANADSLRLALLPLLREKVERNFSHTETPHFFEIGKVFTGVTGGVVDEHWSFAGVLGRRKIKEKQRGDLFLQTKGILETVFETLAVKGVEWKEGPNDETVAVLEIKGNILGSVGVNFWELNFEELVSAIDTDVNYVKPSKYPKMDRDVSVFVPMETRVRDVRVLIESAGAEKCVETELFDVYEDKENNRKSIGFRLVFQCFNETLSDEWTNGEMDKVYKVLSEQPGFEIR